MDSTTRWQTRQKNKKMKQVERLKEFEYKNVNISTMGKEIQKVQCVELNKFGRK